jgi:hypothetical protein
MTLEKLLDKSSLTQADRDCQLQCVKAIKAQINNNFGLQFFVNHSDAIKTLALVLRCESLRIKILTSELLAAICFVPPKGHYKVMEALENLKSQRNNNLSTKHRFQCLLTPLQQKEPVDSETAAPFLEFQVATMSLVNAIVTAPEDLPFRISLRSEFIDLGILLVIPVCSKFIFG